MSQSGLAVASGLPETSISRVENGKSNATLSTVSKLSSALRVKPSDLLP